MTTTTRCLAATLLLAACAGDPTAPVEPVTVTTVSPGTAEVRLATTTGSPGELLLRIEGGAATVYDRGRAVETRHFTLAEAERAYRSLDLGAPSPSRDANSVSLQAGGRQTNNCAAQFGGVVAAGGALALAGLNIAEARAVGGAGLRTSDIIKFLIAGAAYAWAGVAYNNCMGGPYSGWA